MPVQFFVTEGSWPAKLEGSATTDAEGKFRLEGLLPGFKYAIVDGAGVSLRESSVAPPAPGQNADLGDLQAKQDKESP